MPLMRTHQGLFIRQKKRSPKAASATLNVDEFYYGREKSRISPLTPATWTRVTANHTRSRSASERVIIIVGSILCLKSEEVETRIAMHCKNSFDERDTHDGV